MAEGVVEVALGGGSVLARITPDAIARLALAPGTPVTALIKSMSVEILGLSRRGESWRAQP